MGEDDVHSAIVKMLLDSASAAFAAAEYDDAAEYARAVLTLRPGELTAAKLLAEAQHRRFQLHPDAAEERRWNELSTRLLLAASEPVSPRRNWLRAFDVLVGAACVALVVGATAYQDVLWPAAGRSIWPVSLLLIAFKAAAIVFPPLTGGIIGLSGISFVGWQLALLCDYIGTVLGAIAAFWLARRGLRDWVTRRFPLLRTLNSGLGARVSGGRYFRAFLVVRLFTEAIFDWLSWAAGLTRMPFRDFVFATAIGCIPVKVGLFYLVRLGFDSGLLMIVLLVIGLMAISTRPSQYLVGLIAKYERPHLKAT